jgi:hypothetical protein
VAVDIDRKTWLADLVDEALRAYDPAAALLRLPQRVQMQVTVATHHDADNRQGDEDGQQAQQTEAHALASTSGQGTPVDDRARSR